MCVCVWTVFILDSGKDCFVWVGSGASIDERRKGMQYAHVSLIILGAFVVHMYVVRLIVG